MKKWGLAVTLFYSLLVLGLLVPATVILVVDPVSPLSAADWKEVYASWIPWVCAGVVILGEILLLWLSVDTTQRRLKPRTHILVSALTTGLLMAILTVTISLALGEAVLGEKFLDSSGLAGLGAFAIPWLVWGILFYRFCRNSGDPVTRAVAWLFRGSVLELLIAVPSHVIVRRRHECCAGIATSLGITTGIAIMLLSFGPGVLLLFKKRMERYAAKTSEMK